MPDSLRRSRSNTWITSSGSDPRLISHRNHNPPRTLTTQAQGTEQQLETVTTLERWNWTVHSEERSSLMLSATTGEQTISACTVESLDTSHPTAAQIPTREDPTTPSRARTMLTKDHQDDLLLKRDLATQHR